MHLPRRKSVESLCHIVSAFPTITYCIEPLSLAGGPSLVSQGNPQLFLQDIRIEILNIYIHVEILIVERDWKNMKFG